MLEDPAEMLARNNGIVFRASSIKEDGRRLVQHDASIINGRQTTGVLTDARDRLGPECEVAVKVVQVEGDTWPIASAANNQNTVARIDLRLARYFHEQLVQRELASAAGGNEWLTDVMEPLNAREYFGGGEPPADFYPTLHRVALATDEALGYVAGLGEGDPLAKLHGDHRPKYRAYLGLLTRCGTHEVDLSEQLSSLDAEVGRIQEWVTKIADLLDGVGQRKYRENFLLAYEVAGVHAIHAQCEHDDSRVSQRLATSLFNTTFGTLYRQLLLKISMGGADAGRAWRLRSRPERP